MSGWLRAGVLTLLVFGVLVVLGVGADPYQALLHVAVGVGIVAASYVVAGAVIVLLARVTRARSLRRVVFALAPNSAGRVMSMLVAFVTVSPAMVSQADAETHPTSMPVVHEDATEMQRFVQRFGFASDAATMVRDSATYTVQAGDSFWRIAARQVDAVRLDASVRDVAVYWLTLIEANFDVLVDAGNPDLLHVGQVLALPPVQDVQP